MTNSTKRQNVACPPLETLPSKTIEYRFVRGLSKSLISRWGKKGFTLAEVMITMAVIGIVAALLIPRFVDNIYKHVWTNTLLTTYSKLNEGFSHIMTAEQVPEIADTEVFQAIGGDGICSSEMDPNGEECKEFFTKLKKYFKFEVKEKSDEYESIKALDSDDEAAFMEWEGWHEGLLSDLGQNTIQLSDGTLIYYYHFSKHSLQDDIQPYDRYSTIVVDINGPDSPNRFGRDIFKFHISDKGKVMPATSQEDAEFFSKGEAIVGAGLTDKNEIERYIKDNIQDIRRDYANSICPCVIEEEGNESDIYHRNGYSVANGNGCAGRVIEERKMNY